MCCFPPPLHTAVIATAVVAIPPAAPAPPHSRPPGRSMPPAPRRRCCITRTMRLRRRHCRRRHRHQRRSIRLDGIEQLHGIGTCDEASKTFVIPSLDRCEVALHTVACRLGHLAASSIWKGRVTHPDVRQRRRCCWHRIRRCCRHRRCCWHRLRRCCCHRRRRDCWQSSVGEPLRRIVIVDHDCMVEGR